MIWCTLFSTPACFEVIRVSAIVFIQNINHQSVLSNGVFVLTWQVPISSYELHVVDISCADMWWTLFSTPACFEVIRVSAIVFIQNINHQSVLSNGVFVLTWQVTISSYELHIVDIFCADDLMYIIFNTCVLWGYTSVSNCLHPEHKSSVRPI